MYKVSKSIKKVQERGAKNTWLRVTYLVAWFGLTVLTNMMLEVMMKFLKITQRKGKSITFLKRDEWGKLTEDDRNRGERARPVMSNVS